MRVNVHNSSTAFWPQGKDKNPPSYVRGGAVLMPKDPNAAQPNTTSLWDQPVYVPPKNGPVRIGANDFLAVKSKGYRT